nr:discoidin domain-containing protein [Myxococcus sp. RHSTA-1-4]
MVGKSQETSLTSTTSNSVTGYVGGGVDAEAFSVSVKVSGGYEWSASSTSSSGSGDSTSISSAWTNSDDFAIVQNHTYNCYTYQVRQGSTAADSWARFCDHRSVAEESPVLNTWDVQYSPVNNANTSQWAPIVRDWSNLALFRGPFTTQSSLCWSGEPARAVDTNTDGIYSHGSITHTCYESTPWWQVDLGQSQPVGKVRLWNRSKKDYCDEGPCPARLKDFYVFVSDTDFRTISNDPNVLKNDPRVHAYYNPGMGGETTTFLTLAQGAPISGRYVRVQLAGTNSLSLAEVQVFGTNHVEPDRYPSAVRDSTPNDGEFEAEIFDTLSQTYRWVKVKGNLLWDGATRNVLGNKTIGPGGGIASWSLTQERSGWSTEASSTSNTWNAGISLEASAGVFYKVEAGISYEFSSGVTRDEAHTLSWSNSFELGGGVGGFPSTVNNRVVVWPAQCNYQVRPYYYEVTVRSNAGYEHRLMAVDYTVPRTLDRSANMQPCRAGEYTLPSFAAGLEEPASSKLEALLR